MSNVAKTGSGVREKRIGRLRGGDAGGEVVNGVVRAIVNVAVVNFVETTLVVVVVVVVIITLEDGSIGGDIRVKKIIVSVFHGVGAVQRRRAAGSRGGVVEGGVVVGAMSGVVMASRDVTLRRLDFDLRAERKPLPRFDPESQKRTGEMKVLCEK